MRAHRPGQRPIGRQETASEFFSKGDVGGIVSREIRSQFEDAEEQSLVTVSREGKVEVVRNSLEGTVFREQPVQQRPTKTGGDLNVAEGRHVEVRLRIRHNVL
jgi:hypothetical protein